MTPLDATLAELADLERRAREAARASAAMPGSGGLAYDARVAAEEWREQSTLALPAILSDRARLVRERDEARAEVERVRVRDLDLAIDLDAPSRTLAETLVAKLRACRSARDTAIADLAKARAVVEAARVLLANIRAVRRNSERMVTVGDEPMVACDSEDWTGPFEELEPLDEALAALDGPR